MSYWTDTEIKEMELKIPKEDFPLDSDLIVGYKYPFIRYPEDEGDWDLHLQSDIEEGCYIWKINESLFIREKDNGWLGEIVRLVSKYNGTMVAHSSGEDGETDFIRIREGVKKNIKIVEE